MAKKDSIAAYRDRLRSQVPQSHTEPEAEAVEQETELPAEPAPTPVQAVPATPKKPRRSRWTNPYPDAKPFQVSVYLEDEDLVRVKRLRLQLHYARDWMVLKKALEVLEKETGK
jgi:hypothetical protein